MTQETVTLDVFTPLLGPTYNVVRSTTRLTPTMLNEGD